MITVTTVLSQTNDTITSKKEVSSKDIAKKLINPMSQLVSIPIQNNVDFGIGEINGTRNTTSIQPVIPVKLSEKWNLITRVVLPVVLQYNITGVGESQKGLSDTDISIFFNHNSKNKEGIIWGFGPVISAPTGTNTFLSTKKWSTGPSIVGVYDKNNWILGVMINQIWSFAGDKNRDDVNQMFVEPFASYQWDSGTSLSVIGEYTQDWKHDTNNMTLQASLGGITSIGKQKIQISFGPRITLFGPSSVRSNFGITGGLSFPLLN